ASALSRTAPSRAHPPGLYGARGAAFALNIANANTSLISMNDAGIASEAYTQGSAVALEPILLTLATFLILFDALISLGLRGLLPAVRVASMIALGLLVFPHDARAD